MFTSEAPIKNRITIKAIYCKLAASGNNIVKTDPSKSITLKTYLVPN